MDGSLTFQKFVYREGNPSQGMKLHKASSNQRTKSLAVAKRPYDCSVGKFWPNVTGRKYFADIIGLRRYRWTWMTLNGVIAIILRYFTEFDSFGGRLAYVSGSDWPIA